MKSVIKLFVLISVGFCLTAFSLPTPTASPAGEMGGAYLTLAGKFGGEISAQDLSSYSNLGVSGCAKGSLIYQYKLEVRKNGSLSRYAGTSQELSCEMLEHLRSLKAGDSFQFSSVKAMLPSGGKVDVWAKKFVVV